MVTKTDIISSYFAKREAKSATFTTGIDSTSLDGTYDADILSNVYGTITYDAEEIKNIYIGQTQAQSLYVGTTPIKEIYLGRTKVFG